MRVRLKALREKRGLTRRALASALKLSPSDLNPIQNDQRPLAVAVLLRLKASQREKCRGTRRRGEPGAYALEQSGVDGSR